MTWTDHAAEVAKQRNYNVIAERIKLRSLRHKVKRTSEFADSSFKFLSLPVELRMNVYKYLFNSGASIVVDGAGRCLSAEPMSAQLLRTCKAICEEYAEVLYSSCTVTFGHIDIWKGLINIGAQARRCIKEINITPDRVDISANTTKAMYFSQGHQSLLHLSSLKVITVRCTWCEQDIKKPRRHQRRRDVSPEPAEVYACLQHELPGRRSLAVHQ